MSELKRQRDVDLNGDLISDLPNDNINDILMGLPLVDIVRTSILSKKWRFAWASIPKLRFSEEDTPPTAEFISVVDHVLAQYTDELQGFHLKSNKSCEKALDRWFLILLRHPIEEISLVPVSPLGKYCKIPSALFSCRFLKFVELENCILNIPQTFDSFAALRTLYLKTVTINNGFSRLVSSCPLLENLSIRSSYFGNEVDIDIHAPKLRTLFMKGMFRLVRLHTPELVTATIIPWIEPDDYEPTSDLTPIKGSLNEALGHLPVIETLILLDYFVKNVASESPPRAFPTTMSHLRHLELDIDLQLKKDVVVALSLLRKAPLLEYVDFVFDLTCGPNKAMLDLWSSAITEDCIFKNLKIMVIENLCPFTTPATLEFLVEFAELILGTVPKLETLMLYDFFNPNEEEEMLLANRLLQFQRATRKAEIIF